MTTEKKQQFKNYILNTLTVFTSVLPVSLSAFSFMGYHYYYGIIVAFAASLISSEYAQKKIMPAYSVFLILMCASNCFGAATLSLACFICGILSLIYSFLPGKLNIKDNPVVAGIMLSTALTATVMLTTHYFGIGATGSNVKEMIASYLSLGFHPNWRGVLYGTVVMVIMITFPRKFKKFCSVVKAPFIAIVVTLILNHFLNPSDFRTAINEIGNTFIFNRNNSSIVFLKGGEINITAALICGLALFFVCTYAMQKAGTDKTQYKLTAGMNIVCGTSLGLLFPYGTKPVDKKWISGIGSAVLCLAVIIIPQLGRIPVHSLAVVLIVGAWESVEWGEIKKVFSSPASVIFFVLAVFTVLYFGFVCGILISAILYIIYLIIFQKSNRSEKVTE